MMQGHFMMLSSKYVLRIECSGLGVEQDTHLNAL